MTQKFSIFLTQKTHIFDYYAHFERSEKSDELELS